MALGARRKTQGGSRKAKNERQFSVHSSQFAVKELVELAAQDKGLKRMRGRILIITQTERFTFLEEGRLVTITVGYH